MLLTRQTQQFIFAKRMTSILVNVIFIFGSLSSFRVAALPTGTTSYMEDLNLSYTEAKWVCGGIECPVQTFGCRVQRRNNGDKKLDMISTCFDEEKQDILSAADTIDMPIDQRIDIDVESYIGARSNYSSGYGIGHATAKGTLSPNDLDDFKYFAERQRALVDEK